MQTDLPGTIVSTGCPGMILQRRPDFVGTHATAALRHLGDKVCTRDGPRFALRYIHLVNVGHAAREELLVKRIVFEFLGGAWDGRVVEGGANRSLSAVRTDAALKYWFATRCGTPGERFYADTAEAPSCDDLLYQVVDRIEGDEQVIVQARQLAAVKNQATATDSADLG